MQDSYNNIITDQETVLHSMVAETHFGRFFGISQKVFDQVWTNLTAENGNSAIYVSMEIGADLDVYNPVKTILEQCEITGSNIFLCFFPVNCCNKILVILRGIDL